MKFCLLITLVWLVVGGWFSYQIWTSEELRTETSYYDEHGELVKTESGKVSTPTEKVAMIVLTVAMLGIPVGMAYHHYFTFERDS